MINNYPHYYLKKFAKEITVIESDPDNRIFKINNSLYKTLNKPLTLKTYNPQNIDQYAGKALALAYAVPKSSPNKKKIQRLANKLSGFVVGDALLSSIPFGVGMLSGVAAGAALGGSPASIPALAIPAGLGVTLSKLVDYKLKINRYNKLRKLVSDEPNLDITDLYYAPEDKRFPMLRAYNRTLDMLNENYEKQLNKKTIVI